MRDLLECAGTLCVLSALVAMGADLAWRHLQARTSAANPRDRSWPWGLVALTLLGRALTPATVYNWYPVSPDAARGESLSIGLAGVQRALDAWFAPADIAWALVLISGVLLVPLAWDLFDEEGTSPLARKSVSILLAVWPTLWMAGTSDAPHVPALALWLFGALHWRRAHRGRSTSLVLAVLAALALPAIRVEAGVWALGWAAWGWPTCARKSQCAAALAIVAFEVAALSLHAHVSGHTAPFMPLPALALLFSWPVFAPLAMTSHALGAALYAALIMYAMRSAWRARDGRVLRWIGAAQLVFIVPALAIRPPLDHVMLRYSLPLAVLTLVIAVEGLESWLATRSRRQAALSLFGVLAVFGLDAEQAFSRSLALTYRAEHSFLSAAVPELSESATICAVDPNLVHTWPGRHNDFDIALSRPEGRAAWSREGPTWRHLDGGREAVERCDYYYESALCNVDLTEDDCWFFPAATVFTDLAHFRRLCAQARSDFSSTPIASRHVEQRIFWCWGATEPPNEIPIGLYPANRP